MIPVPSGVKVWLATGHTDMRRGFPGLSLMVQETLRQDPMSGHLFVFRGRSGGLIKVIWHDGQGACLFTKKLERGRFIWPSAADGTVFDSAEGAIFPVSGVVPGFGQALQQMKRGGRYEVFIPSDQAYGAQGAGDRIPPNADLTFTVELIDFRSEAELRAIQQQMQQMGLGGMAPPQGAPQGVPAGQ